MNYLVYISKAVTPFSQEQLLELLVGCRRRNTASGISGMLLYKHGDFMQFLEGERGALDALYLRIQEDPRHQGLSVLAGGEYRERQFASWSMAFRNLADPGTEGVEGYDDFMSASRGLPNAAVTDHLGLRLLRMFKSVMP